MRFPVDPSIVVDESVRLCTLRPADAEAFFDLIVSERDDFEPWFPWMRELRDLEHCRKFIAVDIERFSTQERISMGVWLSQEGKHVLLGAIRVPYIEDGDVAEITVLLRKNSRGNGLATKACMAFIHFLFLCGIHRVEAYCGSDNEASVRLFRDKLGFSHEGTRRESLRVNGHFVSLDTYGLLRSDWDV
ncbi:MAG: GNAT family N-acetyltransferase [Candidatus Wildermuthbacteria bacterium]|nr:GNAT family N-acetyltransferase [Candidatus Wildermuthbacteria bacterium]